MITFRECLTSRSVRDIHVDLDNHALVREGAPVAVSHRGLMLLAALVRKAGSVVSKEELMNAGSGPTWLSRKAI